MPGLQSSPIFNASQPKSGHVAIQPSDQGVGASEQGLDASDQSLFASDQDVDRRFADYLGSQRQDQDGLIEILNGSQAIVGCLTSNHLRHIARHLRLPDSHVWGTASFYHLFRLEAPPKHSCLICTGTACFIKGTGPMLKQLQRDGEAQLLKQQGVELGTVRCIGTCGGAPLAVIDGRVCNHQSAQTVLDSLAELATLTGQQP